MEKQKLSVKNSITDYIEWLAQYGASADGGVTRLCTQRVDGRAARSQNGNVFIWA